MKKIKAKPHKTEENKNFLKRKDRKKQNNSIRAS